MSSDTSSSVPRPLTTNTASRRTPTPRPRSEAARRGSGRSPDADLVVDCAVYVDGERIDPGDPHDALRLATERGGFVWLGLYEPSEDELGKIAAGMTSMSRSVSFCRGTSSGETALRSDISSRLSW